MGCQKLTYHQEPAFSASWKIFSFGKEKNVSRSKFCIDYYAYGMQMPGRNGSTSEYSYGFNSMEKDDEIKGQGNSYTTEFRQYDPRVGRWLSLDPLMAKYPNQSPYAAFNNNPIYFIDPDGKDGIASVNQEDTAIMIRAVYFIEISPYGDGFSMDNYKQIMGINEALNQQAYKVTDPNSQYYGYNIKFDLQFERVISKEKA